MTDSDSTDGWRAGLLRVLDFLGLTPYLERLVMCLTRHLHKETQ